MRPTHYIMLTDNTQLPLTGDQRIRLSNAMAEGKPFYYHNDDYPAINIIKDIRRVGKYKYTEADLNPARTLPAGEVTHTRDGPGYRKFLEARKRLAEKMSVRETKSNERVDQKLRTPHTSEHEQLSLTGIKKDNRNGYSPTAP